VLGKPRVEISADDSGVGREVVDDVFLTDDVIVDEREAFVLTSSSNDGNSGQGVGDGSDGLAFTVRIHLDLRLAHCNKFGIQGNDRAFDWSLLWGQGAVPLLCKMRAFRQLVRELNIWESILLEVHVKQGSIQILLPRIVNPIIRPFDLKDDDRGYFPSSVERQSVIGFGWADQEVVEKVPLALFRGR